MEKLNHINMLGIHKYLIKFFCYIDAVVETAEEDYGYELPKPNDSRNE